MYANSPPVVSRQTAPHQRLLEVLDRHRRAPYLRPLAAHSISAFAALPSWLAPPAPIILDSGCGTGASSVTLAERFPQHAVLGVDQSADRLSRGDKPLSRALLLRAPLEDMWRQLHGAGYRLARHYLWYPNPWPKPQHLLRRWHAHPVFPSLIALGGELELRSNWRVYVDEFALALATFGHVARISEIAADEPAVTPFERKYKDSGHRLWCLQARLDQVDP